VIFDFVAHLDPAAWKDWKTARDNGLPAMAGAGSEFIVFDRAATQEALTAFTPHRGQLLPSRGRAPVCR
jgi:hypothetical protein